MKYVKPKVVWSTHDMARVRRRLHGKSKDYKLPKQLNIEKELEVADQEMRRSNARLGVG